MFEIKEQLEKIFKRKIKAIGVSMENDKIEKEITILPVIVQKLILTYIFEGGLTVVVTQQKAQ